MLHIPTTFHLTVMQQYQNSISKLIKSSTFKIQWTSGQRGPNPPIFDPNFLTSLFLKLCPSPSKTFCILQPLNQSKRLPPHYKHYPKTHIKIKPNLLSVQVQLIELIVEVQLCTQDSKKIRHFPFSPTLPPPFVTKNFCQMIKKLHSKMQTHSHKHT